MALRPRIARTSSGRHPVIRSYPLDSAASFSAGDIVVLDAQKEVTQATGTDPTPLLGIALEKSSDVVISGRVLVAVFTGDLILEMDGSSDPVASDVNVSYGIVQSGGVWIVDKTDTTNTRVFVVDIDTDNNDFYVKVLSAHRQSPE
jgi:hypothetical protein